MKAKKVKTRTRYRLELKRSELLLLKNALNGWTNYIINSDDVHFNQVNELQNQFEAFLDEIDKNGIRK